MVGLADLTADCHCRNINFVPEREETRSYRLYKSRSLTVLVYVTVVAICLLALFERPALDRNVNNNDNPLARSTVFVLYMWAWTMLVFYLQSRSSGPVKTIELYKGASTAVVHSS